MKFAFNLLIEKGFYKRSASRKRLYFCLNKNKCNVTVDNRKNCKACRYKKCIDEGMGVEGKLYFILFMKSLKLIMQLSSFC